LAVGIPHEPLVTARTAGKEPVLLDTVIMDNNFYTARKMRWVARFFLMLLCGAMFSCATPGKDAPALSPYSGLGPTEQQPPSLKNDRQQRVYRDLILATLSMAHGE
jgi:hypothetical protein